MSERDMPAITAPPLKPIPAAMERLENQLSKLSEEADQLNDALDRVRMSSPQEVKPEREKKSPGLAGDIAEHADKAEEILCRLQEIRNSLTL